ncbi:hypothetical protein AVDCRST_MAG92-1077 [uncultured Coleofasciculus sp.]|uniref:Uncharacterized protein n=1 Tax=uncultured Coleofasciculus sp. TaxID=1267456 RepID=A0A6J4HRI6_9CYAN|nr:hypothetical protein AVDCRST_MAG92-1077 [uncultured Coleofasciculus sp.]
MVKSLQCILTSNITLRFFPLPVFISRDTSVGVMSEIVPCQKLVG